MVVVQEYRHHPLYWAA